MSYKIEEEGGSGGGRGRQPEANHDGSRQVRQKNGTDKLAGMFKWANIGMKQTMQLEGSRKKLAQGKAKDKAILSPWCEEFSGEKHRLEGMEEEKWLSIIHVIFPYQSLQMMNRCNKSQYSIFSNLHGKKAIIYC